MTRPPDAARLFLALSRPRFWLYLGGSFLVGYTAGAAVKGDFLAPRFWAFLAFFLFPANLLLYGVNDLCDRDTDARNPKKDTHEHRLTRREDGPVVVAVLACLVLGLSLMPWLDPVGMGWMAAFLALSLAYSIPPVRLKARPALDSISNVLYAIPAFLGYHMAAGRLPSPPVLAAGALWTMAMHLFSAAPDIKSDRAAGLATSATVLGIRGSMLVCAALWAACFALIWTNRVLWPLSLLGAVYVLTPIYVLARPGSLERVYWAFPAVNALAGMAAFFACGSRL